jgi:hypothetical protein
VAGLTSSLNDAGRSVVAVDLKYGALRTTSPSASGDAGGCPASCCSADGGQAYALGPYVEAAPGWPVPSGRNPGVWLWLVRPDRSAPRCARGARLRRGRQRGRLAERGGRHGAARHESALVDWEGADE